MKFIKMALAVAALGVATQMQAQTSASDSVFQHNKGNRLSVGGYGEVALSRNFYSDSPFRYSNAKSRANDPSHGRFDIPHAVIYLGYDFGKGWTMGTEIEFEHGGSGSAVEQENEEAGEWETETEKGGEVELEQFWLQKSFCKEFNIRIGHIVVPVGLTNAKHEPLNFFTVYRSEGENTILPSTWHQTGFSLWGQSGDFRYEAQLTSGLDAFMFNRENWIQKGSHSPYEFEVANKYGISARIDNYTIPGLRIGISGYYGQTMHNTFPHDTENDGGRYKSLKGNLYLGAIDFTFNRFNWIVRGNADYGYVSDAAAISQLKRNSTSGSAPYQKQAFGSHAMALSVEAGYDIFSQISKLRADHQKLYVFGHYELYDSYIHIQANKYTKKQILAFGVNYYPVPQIAVKAEYHHRSFPSTPTTGISYNDEPAINIGIAYEGFFL